MESFCTCDGTGRLPKAGPEDGSDAVFCGCPAGAKAWRDADPEHLQGACFRCMGAGKTHVLGQGPETCPRCCGLRIDPTREHRLEADSFFFDQTFPAGTVCRQATEEEVASFLHNMAQRRPRVHAGIVDDLATGRYRVVFLGGKFRLV